MNASKPAGEWQTVEIIVVGNRVTVMLNGQKLHDNAVIEGITGGALDANEIEPGPIMLQGDHGKVWFRKVVVTPITKPGGLSRTSSTRQKTSPRRAPRTLSSLADLALRHLAKCGAAHSRATVRSGPGPAACTARRTSSRFSQPGNAWRVAASAFLNHAPHLRNSVLNCGVEV